mmetsp:Transcript_903/g.2972  ORF Transcript_903/g.2972 Transcript_903/m.2972 type:complete len:235 (-) Transcript_903:517-1221(-)
MTSRQILTVCDAWSMARAKLHSCCSSGRLQTPLWAKLWRTGPRGGCLPTRKRKSKLQFGDSWAVASHFRSIVPTPLDARKEPAPLEGKSINLNGTGAPVPTGRSNSGETITRSFFLSFLASTVQRRRNMPASLLSSQAPGGGGGAEDGGTFAAGCCLQFWRAPAATWAAGFTGSGTGCAAVDTPTNMRVGCPAFGTTCGAATRRVRRLGRTGTFALGESGACALGFGTAASKAS